MPNKLNISRISASLDSIRYQMDLLKAQHGELAGSAAIMRHNRSLATHIPLTEEDPDERATPLTPPPKHKPN